MLACLVLYLAYDHQGILAAFVAVLDVRLVLAIGSWLGRISS